jgi:5-methylcytosine-specific restriction endonuclease McrA
MHTTFWKNSLPPLPTKPNSRKASRPEKPDNSKPILPQGKIDRKKPIAKVSKKNKNEIRALTKETVLSVMERDGFSCVYCASSENLEAHHVFFGSEANRGPDRNHADPLAMLCKKCHFDVHSHGNAEIREFAKWYCEKNKGKAQLNLT